MARVNEESIDTFMSITGVTKDVAVEILEEHGGDLNAAVNAHFSEGDRSTARARTTPVAAPQDDVMDIDDPVEVTDRRDPLSLLSESPMTNPFSILDPNFRRSMFGSDYPFSSHAPFVSQPREVRQIPIEVRDSSDTPNRSGRGPMIEDITGTEYAHGPSVHGTVIVDDDDDDDDEVSVPSEPTTHAAQQTEGRRDDSSAPLHEDRPSAPEYGGLPDYGNDIEEQMIQAAIEASKLEAQKAGDRGPHQGQSRLEDDEFEEVVSLSLKMAEQERLSCEQTRKVEESEVGASEPRIVGQGHIGASNGRLEKGHTSFQDEVEDVDEQPLRRHSLRRSGTRSVDPAAEVGLANDSPPSSPGQNDEVNRPQHNAETFYSDEWGGMSSLEHDEAVMLEAAMFGGIPEGRRYHSAYASDQFMQSERPYPRPMPRPSSPSLQAQRLIREQQDDEYLASLEADREKEMKAKEEAENRRLQEEEARKAALEEERRKEEEHQRKLEEERELKRQLAAKEASLPREPALDDENAITLLVRMPDGSRRGRRFLKSDNLQSLFNFIDVGRTVKPGTYRLVRPYPRRAFSDGESTLTLNELGLTSKQEALFLELI